MLKKLLLGALGVVAVTAGGAVVFKDRIIERLMRPSGHFDVATLPPQPDYAQPQAWAAHPDSVDGADVVPRESGFTDAQPKAPADVFFIHPTTYLTGPAWNAHWDESGAPKAMLEDGVLRHQASAFNGCCRIFAPRYRQAILAAFSDEGDDGTAALDLAYQDVRRAFDHFRAGAGAGRPFLLAGHSQGTLHVERLLQEIAGTPHMQHLVAAYAVGYAVPASMPAVVKVCTSATDTGCMLGWRTLADGVEARKGGQVVWLNGKYQRNGVEPGPCLNPLSFSAAPSDAAANRGALRFSPSAEELPPPLLPSVTGARCDNGVLRITRPSVEGFSQYVLGDGDYHIYDYNLFYRALRDNAVARVAAFGHAPP